VVSPLLQGVRPNMGFTSSSFQTREYILWTANTTYAL
jgi:hypothetical protein